ncbi:MAG: acyl carrier protein [Anaerolineales bacterium]
MSQDFRAPLRDYITAELMRDPGYPLGDDEPIITAGLIDSLSLAQLAIFIEEQFGIVIPDPDLTVDNMNTLDQIVARVQQG